MCFSESASFAASALLLPAGIFCIKAALAKDKAYIPLACMPLAFGLQQGAEGIVWSGINADYSTSIRIGSFAFVFFSHWFWLFWIPWSALNLECNRTSWRICRLLVVLGGLYGAFLYLPLLINEGWLFAAVAHHSIEYQAKFIGDSIPISFSRLLYILIILTPLLISSNSYIKVFGVLVTLFAFITYLTFNYAFVSVWCFFAALLSFYIVYVILKTSTLPPQSLRRETVN